MRTPRAWVAGLLAVSVGMVPVLATSSVAGAEAPGGSAVHAAAAKADAAPPDIEYDKALSVQWVPSSVAGGSGSRPLPVRSVVHASLQYASAVPLRRCPPRVRRQWTDHHGHTGLRANPQRQRGRSDPIQPPHSRSRATVPAESRRNSRDTRREAHSCRVLVRAQLRHRRRPRGVRRQRPSRSSGERAGLAEPLARHGPLRQELATLLGSGAQTTFSETSRSICIDDDPRLRERSIPRERLHAAPESLDHRPGLGFRRDQPGRTLIASTTTNGKGQYSASVFDPSTDRQTEGSLCASTRRQ